MRDETKIRNDFYPNLYRFNVYHDMYVRIREKRDDQVKLCKFSIRTYLPVRSDGTMEK